MKCCMCTKEWMCSGSKERGSLKHQLHRYAFAFGWRSFLSHTQTHGWEHGQPVCTVIVAQLLKQQSIFRQTQSLSSYLSTASSDEFSMFFSSDHSLSPSFTQSVKAKTDSERIILKRPSSLLFVSFVSCSLLRFLSFFSSLSQIRRSGMPLFNAFP